MQSIESCVEAFGQNWFDGPYSTSRNAVGMLVGLRDLVQNENDLHHLRTFIVNTINGCIRTLSPWNIIMWSSMMTDEDSDPNDIGHEDAGADAKGANRVAEGEEGGGQGRGGGSAGTGQQQGGHEDAGGNAEGGNRVPGEVFPVKKRVVARAGAEAGAEAQSARVQGNSKVGMRMLEVMLGTRLPPSALPPASSCPPCCCPVPSRTVRLPLPPRLPWPPPSSSPTLFFTGNTIGPLSISSSILMPNIIWVTILINVIMLLHIIIFRGLRVRMQPLMVLTINVRKWRKLFSF
ncbi:hypothetical protein SLE2022_368480 [Rubroshorea leprosula]